MYGLTVDKIFGIVMSAITNVSHHHPRLEHVVLRRVSQFVGVLVKLSGIAFRSAASAPTTWRASCCAFSSRFVKMQRNVQLNERGECCIAKIICCHLLLQCNRMRGNALVEPLLCSSIVRFVCPKIGTLSVGLIYS